MADLNLAVGDEAWVINSYRTRAFLCKVVEVTPTSIKVRNLDKDQEHTFDKRGYLPKGSLEAAASSPRLVPYEDSEALELETQALNREYRERVNQLLRSIPADPEGFDKLHDLAEEWEEAITGGGDAA